MENNYQETRKIKNIKKIVVKGSIQVRFVASETSSMVVSGGNEECVKAVQTKIIDDELHIENLGTNISISGSGSISIGGSGNRISVNVGNVGGSVIVNGVNITSQINSGIAHGGAPAVVQISLPVTPDITLEGSGDVELKNVSQDLLKLVISGSGDITAEGSVNRVLATVTGSGDICIRDLIARDALFLVIGSGDIDGHVTDSVSAKVMGSGDIRVDGCPAQRSDEVVGSGKIRFAK